MSVPRESPTFGNSLLLRVDGAIGAMSLSPNGRDAVLAGRKGLFVIDLDDPFTPPRWLHHITSWEVADVQWLPHAHAKPSWCVLTLNQKALLWDLLRPGTNAIQNVLHRHTRAITDLHFHPQDPEQLATCLIDTFVFTWDMRTPRRPTTKYAQWRAGATQVKWSARNGHQLALSHHHSFYIWDARKGALPLLKCENAHGGKINGLDFSSTSGRLVTCANDHTVKFWDVLGSRNGGETTGTNGTGFTGFTGSTSTTLTPHIVLHTDYPVARARHLPFGSDACCGIMPVRGGDNAVHIVNYEAEYTRARSQGKTVHMDAKPEYSFKGHGGPVKDFLWRPQHAQNQDQGQGLGLEYQLVTWSPLDFDLKLWPRDKAVYDIANYNPQHHVILGLAPDGDISSAGASTEPESVREPENAPMSYQSYVSEPPISFADFCKDADGDVLTRLARYTIKKTHTDLARSSQLNHLSWISGVRMGRQPSDKRGGPDMETGVGVSNGGANADADADEGPANLGEEISIVGHKFSKLRFEKISVSTGHIEISMRGPRPVLPEEPVDTIVQKKDVEKRNSVSESGHPLAVSASTGSTTALKQAQSQNLAQNLALTQGLAPNASTNTATAQVPGTALGVTQNIPHNPNTRPAALLAPVSPVTATATAATTGATSTIPAGTATTSTTTTQRHTENAANTSLAVDSPPEQKLIFIRLEIKFPKLYPFLEPVEAKHASRKYAKYRRSNQIRFDIEETHELNAAVKQDMLRNLNDIAQFYSNKYHKYCLEPCLRYLMGEKIDLDDSLMVVNHTTTDDEDLEDGLDATENSLEIGNENWVDDLIDQHEAAASFARDMVLSADEEDDEDADLIFGNNDKLALSVELSRRAHSTEPGKADALGSDSKIKHDSTPLPKGCGAVWTQNGGLVCFFIPKSTDSDSTTRPTQKLSVFKFTDNGFGLKTSEKSHRRNHGAEISLEKRIYVPSESDDDSDLDANVAYSDDDTFSINSSASSSSSDSFSNDWDEMLQDDIPSRSRMPGMFRDTVALGRRSRIDEINKNAMGRTLEGKGSAYRSSAHDDAGLKSTRKGKKSKRGKSVVSILDFKHLIPDKYELACDYRVLGDSPELIARHNSDVAFHHGYEEIGRVWRIVEMLLVKEVRLRDLNEVGKDFFHTNSGSNCDFYWGNHPLGHSWMVRELFDYFEKKRDLQMLAMLSCLFFENLSNLKANDTRAFDIPIHTPYPSLPPRPSVISMREHGLISSEEALAGNESLKSLGTDRHRSISRKPSFMSSLQFSRPFSPDLMQYNESPSRSASLKYSQFGSYQLGSAPFVESFSQAKTLDRTGKSFENSKLFSRFSTNARKGSKGILHKGKGSTVPHNMRERARPPPLYTIEIKNVDLLDLYENKFSAPLLSGIDQNKILEYREQYAEMLYTWGLPLHRIKILKFNYPQGAVDSPSNAHYDVHKCSFGSRYRKAFNNKQLLLTPITPIPTAKDNVWNTQKRNSIQYCGYCGLIVSKRVVVCTKCEHIVHSHCAAEWWAADDSDDVIEECPTGCGCSCLLSGST